MPRSQSTFHGTSPAILFALNSMAVRVSLIEPLWGQEKEKAGGGSISFGFLTCGEVSGQAREEQIPSARPVLC